MKNCQFPVVKHTRGKCLTFSTFQIFSVMDAESGKDMALLILLLLPGKFNHSIRRDSNVLYALVVFYPALSPKSSRHCQSPIYLSQCSWHHVTSESDLMTCTRTDLMTICMRQELVFFWNSIKKARHTDGMFDKAILHAFPLSFCLTFAILSISKFISQEKMTDRDSFLTDEAALIALCMDHENG